MTSFQLSLSCLALVLCGCCEEAASTTPQPGDGGAGEESVLVQSGADTRTWGFDESSPGQLPAGVVSAVGRWEVAADETAPSGALVLAQLASSANSVFNVALIPNTSYQDVDLSVQLRAISGRVDQGGGLIWRAGDAENYYVARYNPLEDNLRVYKVVEGRRKKLVSATLHIDHAAWHTLRIVMDGDHIECSLDGTKVLHLHDDQFPAAGQIGLWTKADAQTHFDDLGVAEIADADSASGGAQ